MLPSVAEVTTVVKTHATPTRRFRCTLLGDGRFGPIEERIGRRLVRLVEPASTEGRSLLDSGEVSVIGPDGASLGRLRRREAYAELLTRLEQRLTECENELVRTELAQGLERLRSARQELDPTPESTR